eukprot:5084803-Amphidinium_carterae.2
MPQAGSSALEHRIQSVWTSPCGEVKVTLLRGRLAIQPCNRSMGKSSGAKFQSPKMKIILFLRAATAAKRARHSSRFSSILAWILNGRPGDVLFKGRGS